MIHSQPDPIDHQKPQPTVFRRTWEVAGAPTAGFQRTAERRHAVDGVRLPLGARPGWRYPLRVMICLLLTSLSLSILGTVLPAELAEPEALLWRLASLESVGEHPVQLLCSPALVDAAVGKAVEFAGDGDALLVESNPLAGLSAFTIEVVFRPDPGGASEQRFLHFQEVEDHRVLMETRLTGDGQWFLDSFLKSGESEKTLYAKDHRHVLGEWYHGALSYDGTSMRHYVNGQKELEGVVSFAPMESGATSIGCRLNRVYWFKGAIALVRITSRALTPSEFTIPEAIRSRSR